MIIKEWTGEMFKAYFTSFLILPSLERNCLWGGLLSAKQGSLYEEWYQLSIRILDSDGSTHCRDLDLG